MMNGLSLELKKTKRRGIWLVFAALLGTIVLWGGANVSDARFLKFGWRMVLYNLPLLNAVLIPTGIAVFASRIIDMEHKGNTWKLLETLEGKFELYLAKVLYGLIAVLLFSIAELLLFAAVGLVVGFEGTPDLWAFWAVFCTDLCDHLKPVSAANASLTALCQSGSRLVRRTVRQHGWPFPDVCAVADFEKYRAVGTLRRSNVCQHGLE